ncbi:MAG TPA: serine hydrolase domain-containing protein [Thermoanaerobaculia bacterium]|nr:serine hydrolase domain-containing protein [Thermoanaerobaculia bacterium]
MRVDGELTRLAGTRAELERGVAEGLQSGGQIYVARDGEVLADAGFGEARPGEPMQREQAMFWLSSTKPFAALAIARLWEQGALDLDDPVAKHVPEFGAAGKERVTVLHLLTHTGGIRMVDLGWPERGWDEIVARVCARKLEPGWIPGRKAGYHLGSSWFVLGEMVRRIDGRRFERWAREELLEPIGATGSWIGVPPERLDAVRARLAPMFEIRPEGPRALDWASERHLTSCSPGASGLGPMRELARLYTMLLGGGEIDGRRLLSPQTVAAVTARHRVGLVDQTFRTRLDWGLGVILDSKHYGDPDAPYQYGPHAGPRTYGHSGARSSTAFADPDARMVVAVAVNGLTGDEVHRERFERLTRALYEDLGLAEPGASG